jgi:hypothetical protein
MLKAWVSQVRRHLKHRKDVKEAIKATKRIADDIAAREKAVTDKYEKQALHSEYFDEHDQIWGPIEAYQSDRLVERARKMEIDVPRQPNSYEDDENWDWIPYGGWCLTDAAKKKIKNEIKEIRRQEYEEFRKWTTLMVAGASIFISLLALLWKTKAPDPCPKNYYRSDSGECVFALKPAPTPSPTSQTTQPVPGTKPSPAKPKTP